MKMVKSYFSYGGALVLGIHDALVTLTGTIAGLTISLTERNLIILTSVISSVVAALSMSASSYLATRTNQSKIRIAITAGCITGSFYIITCTLLILPFVFNTNINTALLFTFINAILIIFLTNLWLYFKNKNLFIHRFVEMISVCATVSIIAFFIGQLAKKLLNI